MDTSSHFELIGSKVTIGLLAVVGSIAQIYEASVCFCCSATLLQAQEASMVQSKVFPFLFLGGA
jgi:hypothetical protein